MFGARTVATFHTQPPLTPPPRTPWIRCRSRRKEERNPPVRESDRFFRSKLGPVACVTTRSHRVGRNRGSPTLSFSPSSPTPPPPPPFPPPLCGAGFRQADLLLPPPKSRRSSPTPLLFLPSQTPPGSSTHPGRGPPLPTGRPPGSHHSAAPTEPASNRRRRTDRDYVILTPASDILDCAPNPATSPQPPPPLPRVRLIKWVVGKRGRSKSNSTGRKISFFSGISGRQCRLFLVCLFRGRHL